MGPDDELEEPSLGFLLVRLGEAIDHRFTAAMAELRLRPRELRALVLVDRHPGGSQRELARRMAVDPGNLVALVEELERRRLITRRVDAGDRRRRTLRLTAAGAALLARATAATEALERDVLASLSDDQRTMLRSMALQVWRANREHTAGAHPG